MHSWVALDNINKECGSNWLPSLKGRIKEAMFQSQYIPIENDNIKTPNFQQNLSMWNFDMNGIINI